jgi:hypothetical protein
LIICFIIRKVPELVDARKLIVLVPESKIRELLSNSTSIFSKVFILFKKWFDLAER